MVRVSTVIFIALAIDAWFGEPRMRWHPVAVVGKAMELAEKIANKRAVGGTGTKVAGLVVTTGFVVITYLATSALVQIGHSVSYWLGLALQLALIWLSISLGELLAVARQVNNLLEGGQTNEARNIMRTLVGRDTGVLSERQIRGGVLESVAENFVDAGLAPIFYALIGGGPLAFTYRVINTLDSMFGYKDERFVNFGWASARLDDIATWVPGRLAVLAMAAVNMIDGRGFKGVVKTAFTDGRLHPSPNSGLPIAALAGALDIRLGGERLYAGETKTYGYFGRPAQVIAGETILRAELLVKKSALLALIIGVIISKGLQWATGSA